MYYRIYSSDWKRCSSCDNLNILNYAINFQNTLLMIVSLEARISIFDWYISFSAYLRNAKNISKKISYYLLFATRNVFIYRTVKISLTKVDTRLWNFFLPPAWFCHVCFSWICPVSLVEQGHVFDSFLNPDPCRAPLSGEMRAHAIKTYVQWYIDLFRSRARSKGIGFTSLFLCVTSRYPLAVFVLFMSFPFSRISSFADFAPICEPSLRDINCAPVYLSLLCTTSRASSRLA